MRSVVLGLYLFFFWSSVLCDIPMVVVVPTYNNQEWCIQNLDSIFLQDYSNYRVVIVDDASTDDTFTLIQEYIAENHLEDRVHLSRNKTRLGPAANRYQMICGCDDGEVILCLDGDDWFAHGEVMARINEIYQDEGIWLTWGQFQYFPNGKIGLCEPFPEHVIRSNSFRKHKWVTSHLKTFYAGLFKRVKREDFLQNGQFVFAASDLAMMFPMLEMAGERIRFIDEVLYIYNRANSNNVDKVTPGKQGQVGQFIRSKKKKYDRLPDGTTFTLFRSLLS